jgi:hypothetical protein
MIVDQPWSDLPAEIQKATEAYESVLDGAGATLPARDMVDVRIVRTVRDGSGAVIGTELDLPSDQRWPGYRSLPRPLDSDNDGLPDYWERQHGLDSADKSDSATISAGYANIEHYFNNTDPRGGPTPIVFIAAAVPRARLDQPAIWRICRTGNLSKALTVNYSVSGEARSDRDFLPLAGSATIPANEASTTVSLTPLPAAGDNLTVVIGLEAKDGSYHVGCPSQSLAVIRERGL